MPHLGRRLDVLALDIVGYGLTPGRGPQDYPSAAQGEFIIRFIRTLGIRPHLGGNSHGGWLAQYVAHEAPDLVRKLIIINSGAGTTPVPAEPEGMKYVYAPEGNARPKPTLKNIRESLQHLFFNQHLVSEARVQRTYEIARRNHSFARERGLATSATVRAKNENLKYRGKHIAEYASELNRPVLLTWSRENIRVTPVDAMDYFNRLSQVEMHVFSRAGHHVMVEHPKRWSSVVTDFVLADL
jgi:pimeloyl-ACP methyl ester carboxylesterase